MAQADGRPLDRADNERSDGSPTPGRRSWDSSWRLVLNQRKLPLDLGKLSIGSDPDSGLQLNHHSIQKNHAALQKRGDSFVLRAMGGAPVKVDDKPVAQVQLRGGERIRIGDIEMRIEKCGPPPELGAAGLARWKRQQFYAHVRRELARVPWLMVSVAIHAGLFFLLYRSTGTTRPAEVPVIFTARFERHETVPELSAPAPAELATPEPARDVLELPEIVVTDDPIDAPVEVADPIELDSRIESTIGLGPGMRPGGGIPTHRSGLGKGKGVRLDRVDRGLASTLSGFRDGGLDLVVLLDTTSSMDTLIAEAKRAIDEIVTNLAALVPDLRIGMVAYRDHGETDQSSYVTRSEDLCDDRYRILNFLETLEAGGGEDIPEAILEGMSVAFDDLSWRQQAHHVVLLIGDAPPHAEDVSKLRELLRSRCERGKGRTFVSAICVAREEGGSGRDDMMRATRSFEEIAKVGGGEYSQLSRVGEVGEELVTAVLGREHRAAIADALRRSRRDGRDVLIEEKVRARDFTWMLQQFNRGVTDPLLISALIELQYHGVAQRCLALLGSDDADRPIREAALYIVRRTTDYRGSLDLGRPAGSQRDELDEVRNAVRRSYADVELADPAKVTERRRKGRR